MPDVQLGQNCDNSTTNPRFAKWFLSVAVRTIPSDQVCLIGSTGLDSGLVLVERSVKEWVGVLRDSTCGLLEQCFIQDEVCIEVLI